MNKTVDKKVIEKLLRKLNQPVHINYISSHLLRMEMEDTRKVINTLIDEELIEESQYAKDYYQTKVK